MNALLFLAALAAGTDDAPNFLFIIADDLGVDRVGAYGEHPDPGHTPNIDRLANLGVLFRNAYANPRCTPSRATLLTGRYSYRTGMGENATYFGGGPSLDPSEVLLEEALVGYSSEYIGKWHLVSGDAPDHPNAAGLADYSGGLHNLLNGVTGGGTYFNWQLTENGQQSVETEYATTWTTNRAIAAVEGLPEPWSVWVSYNAPHVPAHAPPQELHSYDLTGLGPDSDRPVFVRAMAEAMDTEIGRLLRSIDRNTIVIFMGDNGTGRTATDAPFDPEHAKGTLYEGGINVPLIVFGPGVERGGECTALVNSTDIFATVLELAGLPSAAEDSVSLRPYLADPQHPSLRETAYSELFTAQIKRQAIRNERFKLIRKVGPVVFQEEFYDLDADPWEQVNLLETGMGSRALEAYSRFVQLLP